MIGIIGGTFDPIHLGHLRPALEITEKLELDEMRFIPSAKPPHRWQPEASAEDRLAMVRLAVEGTDKFIVDDREYHREGASYTVDTLATIRAEIGETTPLCMLIGVDAFDSFTQWHDWQKILELTHLVISPRPGYSLDLSADWIKDRLVKSAENLRKYTTGKLFISDVVQFDISATYIREQALKKRSLHYLTPKSVCDHIEAHGLYKPE